MVGVVVAFVVALLWGVLAWRVGPGIGWVDRPDGSALKVHQMPAVPLGGVGVFLAVHAGLLVEGLFSRDLFVVSGLLLALGLIDDRVGVPPIVRLLVEGVAGTTLAIAMSDQLVERIVIAVLLVAAVNAVNLFDGLDGLAGVSGAVSALGVAWLASSRGFDPKFGLTLAAGLAAFLIWNWHPARLFLGDNGAYVMACFLVYGIAGASGDLADLAAAVVVLGVFFVDLAATILRRISARRPLFSGDRSHLYDRLVDRDWPEPMVAVAAAGLQTLIVILVVTVDRSVPSSASIAVLWIVGVALVGVMLGVLRLPSAQASSQDQHDS